MIHLDYKKSSITIFPIWNEQLKRITRLNSKEAAEMFGLTTDTIRYYERVGVIPRK